MSTGAGPQPATVAVLALPALAEAGPLILAGLLARSLRGPVATTHSLLVAGLGAVAFPIGALWPRFGGGGAPYAAIVAAANADAGAALGAILVVAGGLITALVLAVRRPA